MKKVAQKRGEEAQSKAKKVLPAKKVPVKKSVEKKPKKVEKKKPIVKNVPKTAAKKPKKTPPKEVLPKKPPIKKSAPRKAPPKKMPAEKAPPEKPSLEKPAPAAQAPPKIRKPKMVLPESRILYGFAGMPVSAKARTIPETIVYAHNMALEVLEIQLTHGTEIEDEETEGIKVLAEQAKIVLTVHAPYYTNLAEGKELIEHSMERLKKSLIYASKIGARILVVHLGFFREKKREEAFKTAIQNLKRLAKFRDKKKINVLLGIENAGDDDIIGDMDEVVEICRNVKGVVPALDMAHYHARTGGSLKDIPGFEALFEKLKPLNLEEYYIHISGMNHKDNKELGHVPIKKSDLNYTAFAEFVLRKGLNVYLISDSPVLEYDAVTMRITMGLVKEKLTGIPVEEVKAPLIAERK